MNWARLRAKDLSAAALDVESVYYDWSDGGWGEKWETVDPANAMTKAELRDKLEDWGIEYSEDDDDDTLRDLLRDTGEWGDEFVPAMNYYYPLPHFQGSLEKAQASLMREHINCAVVSVVNAEEEWMDVLALTGGGMDLSWDIAIAYMVCGYIPPAFLSLPQYSGSKATPRKMAVLRAMRRGVAIRRRRANNDMYDIKRMERYLKGNG